MVVQLWRLLKPFHRVFARYIVLLFIYESMQIAESYVLSGVITLFNLKVTESVWIIGLVGIVLYDVAFIFMDNAIDWHIITRQGYPIFKYLKTRAISKFLEMEMAWHQKHNSGTLVGKVNQGTGKVHEIIDAVSWDFLPTIMQTILSLIPLLILSPLAVGVAILALGVFLYLSILGYRRRRPLRQRRHDRYDDEWRMAAELVRSTETLRMFGQTERLYQEYSDLHDNIIRDGMTEARIGVFGPNRWRMVVLSFARRLILVVWIWQLYQGSIDIAGLIYANVLMEKLFHSFWRMARLFEQATEASESAQRLAHLLEQQPVIMGNHAVHNVPHPIGIQLEGVSFSYSEEDERTIHDLSLDIQPGQIVALVGPSGAGKTTLRKLITGMWPLQTGSVKVGGIDIREWSHAHLLHLFSYVPQGGEVYIFDESIYYNIAISRPDATIEEIEQAATLAGIAEFISDLPDGYQTQVGERGIRLSGGQQQRIALARAILADRPILILDEATSAVDAITEKRIQALMRTILAGRTAIIIAHRLSTIWDLADKIVVLEKGRKIEEGTHSELMEKGGLYAEMVGLQVNTD